jgi:type IV pilus assembly protein PilQ
VSASTSSKKAAPSRSISSTPSLPAALQRRLDVADFATPAQLIETFEQGKNVRMLVTPKGKWDYSAHQTGNQFVMDIRSLDDPSLAKSDKPIYSGEKLTLNFQNVEVRAQCCKSSPTSPA